MGVRQKKGKETERERETEGERERQREMAGGAWENERGEAQL